jgi:coiled-coil domain-containing protein 12
MSSSHTNLSAASNDRKSRLAQLRSLKRKAPEPSTDDFSTEPTLPAAAAAADEEIAAEPPPADEEEAIARKYLSGRNYDIANRAPKLGFEAAPDAAAQATIERRAAELESRARAAAAEEDRRQQQDGAQLDLFKLQPKKPNWDLKRELAQRMNVLDVRTENAIARLVRERVAGQQQQQEKKIDGDANGGLEGADLVEALNVREREEAEDEEREREWEMGLVNGEP